MLEIEHSFIAEKVYTMNKIKNNINNIAEENNYYQFNKELEKDLESKLADIIQVKFDEIKNHANSKTAVGMNRKNMQNMQNVKNNDYSSSK